MTKFIIDSYRYEDEAIEKVIDLKIEGYSAEDITIITNSKNTDSIKRDIDVELQKGKPDIKPDESFKEKVIRIFTDDITNPDEQLMALGIPKDQAELHNHDLKSGKYIVVVNQK